MRSSRWLHVPLWVTYAFLYVPIVVLVVMSFNSGRSAYSYEGFSLKWYGELAEDELVRDGLVNTLIVAAGSTVIATVLAVIVSGVTHFDRSLLVNRHLGSEADDSPFCGSGGYPPGAQIVTVCTTHVQAQ